MVDTAFVQELRRAIGDDAVTDRAIDLSRFAHDASHYLLRPQAVVLAAGTTDVARAVAVARAHRVGVTFRSGGTSLSGQGGGDGVLIDTRRGFRSVEVLDDGARVRCQPGATVRAVNARLAPYGRILGPDPASEIACTIGGVVADNSSGMACGTTQNTYRTLAGLEIVLLSGTVVDTAAPDADAQLRAVEPELWQGLARLRDRVRGNPDSVRRIAHQFSMKNTMGYGLNSFLDFDDPVQILAHLMVGSEGTLGFIASATFHTVPLLPKASTALLVFDTIAQATDALPDLVGAGARTAELMDAASLRVAQALPNPLEALRELKVRQHTALLVEAQGADADELAGRVADLSAVVARLDGLTALRRPAAFSADPQIRARSWQVRKGLYTAVAGARRPGSTALLEDIVVPMPALTATVAGLGELCAGYGYRDAVIFGHAKDANLHFMIDPDLRDPAQVTTLAAFTEELVDLVLGVDGSLKAEHGTGRAMAPFVERQYGSELYGVMRALKQLLDPDQVLNPGVIISTDPQAHLSDLKRPELVDPLVDRCVECGYCEPSCPSKDVTTTPRQRIALLRDVAAGVPGVEPDYSYAAVQTCAADSLCLLACPVSIDTGVFMKQHRRDAQPKAAQRIGVGLAEHWKPTLTTLRAALAVADTLPGSVLGAVTDTVRRVLPTDLVPRAGDDLPGPGEARAKLPGGSEPAEVVFFASCMGELFEPSDAGAPGPARAFLALCERAGLGVRLPEELPSLCCGTVWRSKGLVDGAAAMAVRTATSLLRASEDGRLPVVCEASSCSHGLHELAHDLELGGETALAEQVARLTVIDSTRFVNERLLPALSVPRRLGRVVLHPTCSDRHAGDVEQLRSVAAACADEVVIPFDAGCCAFAGDRGLLHPELTASATAREAAEVRAGRFDDHLSSNRTCELGMTRATGRRYRHAIELLEELTRAEPGSSGRMGS
ncbi:MAG: FAD-binding and (Fe-S)-binding domain-containing protein [Micropruina sp.]|uniref:FAD-binding and (Fe-S)-binding domain-containing protein n=1 Tax=Micropruina sp. TaxID=2737536 RepID=UPI0039E4995F